ncbi:hypothetical protein C8J57DRAFT_1247663 [Mycena rebaudengoi]|nr:hypothetical protein C8J57DRAFT_1247663 [Mycena rebaudengoi]
MSDSLGDIWSGVTCRISNRRIKVLFLLWFSGLTASDGRVLHPALLFNRAQFVLCAIDGNSRPSLAPEHLHQLSSYWEFWKRTATTIASFTDPLDRGAAAVIQLEL